ncbi:BTB/POZ domain-containing protein [Phycomyces blakesleeanus]|uniref:BTB/POZ domain-containing protein n=1 Tax=Phycomyces blakesleeanus TaxID=4837 RepID=A0ABR3AXN4_PHYBL
MGISTDSYTHIKKGVNPNNEYVSLEFPEIEYTYKRSYNDSDDTLVYPTTSVYITILLYYDSYSYNHYRHTEKTLVKKGDNRGFKIPKFCLLNKIAPGKISSRCIIDIHIIPELEDDLIESTKNLLVPAEHKLKNYIGSNKLHDIVIHVTESKDSKKSFESDLKKDFYGHKVILAAESLFFEDMFTCNIGPKTKKEITIHEMNPDIFEQILGYIYSHKLTIADIDNAKELVLRGDYLQIPAIIEQAKEYIYDVLSVNILWDTWKWSEINHCNEINEVCKMYFSNNIEASFLDPAWENAYYPTTLKALSVKNIQGTFSEASFYHAAVKWRKEISTADMDEAETKYLNEHFSLMLQNIRFGQLDFVFLADTVQNEPLVMSSNIIDKLLLEAYRYKASKSESKTLWSRCHSRAQP